MFLIVGLIIIGIILLVLEILILPGLIAGVIGVLFLLVAISWMYRDYGTTTGNITLASTIVLTALSIYGSLKSRAWNRFGLKTSIDGKMNEVGLMGIKEGDEAVTISALRPSGTIMVNDARVEAQTNGELIDTGTKVIVTRVLPNKVLVKIKVTEL